MGVIEKQSIQDIADAIRDRNGLTTLYKPRQMDEAIRGLYKTEAVNHVFDNLTVSTTKEGTSFTLDDAEESGAVTELKGNTTQEGTPIPTSPVEVKTVSGDNNVVVSNKNLLSANFSDYIMSTGNYGYIQVTNKNELLWLSLTDKNTTGDISGIYFGFSGTGYNASGGVKWALNNGTISSTGLSNQYTNGYHKYICFYPKNEATFNKIFSRFNVQIEKGNQATSYIAHQGNSYRVDFGGKNLIMPRDTSVTVNGVTVKPNGDGTFTANGTATTTSSINIMLNPSNYITMDKNVPFTYSVNVISGTGQGTFPMAVYKEDNTIQYNYMILRPDNNEFAVTKTSTEDLRPREIVLYFTSGGVFDNFTFALQLEQSSGVTPYSPYVSNPIELCKIGNYVDSIKKSTGKNLFNKDDVENDKRLDSAGQPTGASASGFSLTNYIKVEPNTKYTLSRNTTSSTYYVNISEYTSDKTHIQRLYCAGNTTTTYTFTTPNNCEYLRINDATTNLYSIQLELRRNCNKSRTLWNR